MGDEDRTGAATGATPGTSATPVQATGGGTGAGATPGTEAGGKPAAPASSTATGEEALGDTGKALLAEARRLAREAENRAKAAETRANELESGQQTEAERAVSAAKREAAAEERAKWAERARKAEVRGALRGAGIVDDAALELALGSPTFQGLKVNNETGDVEGVSEAIEEFKARHAYLFGAKDEKPATPPPGGSWGGSEGGRNDSPVAPGGERLRRAYSQNS